MDAKQISGKLAKLAERLKRAESDIQDMDKSNLDESDKALSLRFAIDNIDRVNNETEAVLLALEAYADKFEQSTGQTVKSKYNRKNTEK